MEHIGKRANWKWTNFSHRPNWPSVNSKRSSSTPQRNSPRSLVCHRIIDESVCSSRSPTPYSFVSVCLGLRIDSRTKKKHFISIELWENKLRFFLFTFQTVELFAHCVRSSRTPMRSIGHMPVQFAGIFREPQICCVESNRPNVSNACKRCAVQCLI